MSYLNININKTNYIHDISICQLACRGMSRINKLSGSVANELSGFMISHGSIQGEGHETGKIATGAIDVSF